MSRTLVLFDFDGTITTTDSFNEFIRFTHGKNAFYSGLIKHSPFIFLYYLKLLDGAVLKEKMLSTFFRGKTKDELRAQGREFIAFLHREKMIKPGFIELIKKYQAEGAEVAVVSASPDIWINSFCEQYGIAALCTGLEFKGNLFSGKIDGRNCNGPEKKKRILEKYKLADYETIVVYGDSKGDREMMELATIKNWI